MGVGALMFFLFMRPSKVKKLLLSLARVYGVLRPKEGLVFVWSTAWVKIFTWGKASLIGWCMPV